MKLYARTTAKRLCADKSDAVVKYTLLEDNKQILASRYMDYIPSKEEFLKEFRFDDTHTNSDN